MWRVTLVAGLVEVLQLGATGGRVGLEVKVGAIGNTFKFTPAPREEELNVGRTGRVVTEFIGVVVTNTNLGLIDT